MIITRTPLRISLGGGAPTCRVLPQATAASSSPPPSRSTCSSRSTATSTTTSSSSTRRSSGSTTRRTPTTRCCARSSSSPTCRPGSRSRRWPTSRRVPGSARRALHRRRAAGALPRTGARIVSNIELAEHACHIEIERLEEPIGKQDQYIAAVGGITAFKFEPDETVDVQPLDLSTDDAGPARRQPPALLHRYPAIGLGGPRRRDATRSAAYAAADLDANLDAVKGLGRETIDGTRAGRSRTFGVAAHGAVAAEVRAITDSGAPPGRRLDPGRHRSRRSRRQARRRR